MFTHLARPDGSFPFSDTIKFGEMAVETGLVVLYEIETISQADLRQ